MQMMTTQRAGTTIAAITTIAESRGAACLVGADAI